jgi:hypothetical protein
LLFPDFEDAEFVMSNKKVSNEVAAIVAGLALALGAWYVLYGIDWYYKGRLIMCTCELSVDPKSWCCRPGDPECQPRPREACENLSGVNPILCQSLSSITRCYRGKTAQAEYEQSFSHRFALWWNKTFEEDEKHREALAAVVTVLYVAYLGFAAAVLKDWLVNSE